jgi:GNAT superfamily N-acetyltransferase
MVITPTRREVIQFCRADPIERVFLEDMVRRGFGRISAVRDGRGLAAVAHVGVNVVPSGRGCGAFAPLIERDRSRMIIGDEEAVSDLWEDARRLLPRPREDRPGQPLFVLDEPPQPAGTGLRTATVGDLELLLPACAAAHEEELGSDPLTQDPEGFRWRTRALIEEGRSWLWAENGSILFKAEASAWTQSAVHLQQVWVDPEQRNKGYAQLGLRDLFRLLLARTRAVCLFVRPENEVAIHVYERVGMRRHGTFRSVLL